MHVDPLFKAVQELRAISPKGKIADSQSRITIGLLPHKTKIFLGAETPIVEATPRAIKHIIDKNCGGFLALKATEIIARHESIFESKTTDRETGLHRIVLVKRYPGGRDLFAVIELKFGAANQLVTVARVGKNYLKPLKKIL
ncbi:MAG TPA: hypothetical protein VIJ29_03495 [Candidatus Paceibacterota bacterium]